MLYKSRNMFENIAVLRWLRYINISGSLHLELIHCLTGSGVNKIIALITGHSLHLLLINSGFIRPTISFAYSVLICKESSMK